MVYVETLSVRGADFIEAARVAGTPGWRLLTREDDSRGCPAVAVLGHDLWRTAYGASPGVVGRAVSLDVGTARISATVRTRGVTGVEMEALTAATVAALTLYDMLKAVDRLAEIEQVKVLAKSGGKSGDWARTGEGTA